MFFIDQPVFENVVRSKSGRESDQKTGVGDYCCDLCCTPGGGNESFGNMKNT